MSRDMKPANASPYRLAAAPRPAFPRASFARRAWAVLNWRLAHLDRVRSFWRAVFWPTEGWDEWQAFKWNIGAWANGHGGGYLEKMLRKRIAVARDWRTLHPLARRRGHVVTDINGGHAFALDDTGQHRVISTDEASVHMAMLTPQQAIEAAKALSGLVADKIAVDQDEEWRRTQVK